MDCVRPTSGESYDDLGDVEGNLVPTVNEGAQTKSGAEGEAQEDLGK